MQGVLPLHLRVKSADQKRIYLNRDSNIDELSYFHCTNQDRSDGKRPTTVRKFGGIRIFTEQAHPKNVLLSEGTKTGVAMLVFHPVSLRSAHSAPSLRATPRPPWGLKKDSQRTRFPANSPQHLSPTARDASICARLSQTSSPNHFFPLSTAHSVLNTGHRLNSRNTATASHNRPQTMNNKRIPKQSHRDIAKTLPALQNRRFSLPAHTIFLPNEPKLPSPHSPARPFAHTSPASIRATPLHPSPTSHLPPPRGFHPNLLASRFTFYVSAMQYPSSTTVYPPRGFVAIRRPL